MSTLLSTNIIMRPYAGEADLPAIADLLNACEAVDRLDNSTSIDKLRQDFAEPEWDLDRDLRVWQDKTSRLLGFAAIWRRPASGDPSGYLRFHVHPEARGGGLEAQIFAWAEQRMRDVIHEPGAAVQLRANARDTHAYRVAVLEQHGFVNERIFYRMARSLSEPLPELSFPAGFTLRTVEVDRDGEAWVEMFNASFIDHWNHQPMTIEQFYRS